MSHIQSRARVPFLSLLVAIATLTIPMLASADTISLPHNIANAKILSIGCHGYAGDDGTCWINIDKTSPLCKYTNQPRFVTAKADGKNVYSLVTAAFLAGKTVSIQVNGCIAGGTDFPEIAYIQMD